MRIARFVVHGITKYGVLEGCEVRALQGSPYDSFKGPGGKLAFDGSAFDPGAVRLLAPCQTSKIVAVGLNYRRHAEEFKSAVPTAPLIFLKPSTSVIGPGEPIVYPRGATRVDFEGELGVVIGREAKDVPRASARDYVLGYTIVNDVTEREMQGKDGQWTRAKGFDTFAPLGPWIENEISPDDLEIETRLNGEVRQCGRTSDLVFGVDELIEFISGVMTLLPGDVISTGTPPGIGPMKAGDVVEVTIEGIGTLANPVVRS